MRALAVVRSVGSLLALALGSAAGAFANGWPKTLVSAPQALVYAEASLSAPVRLKLPHATMVQVRKVDGEWSDVMVALPTGGGKTIDAWMRNADLLQSAGMTAFWNKQFADAADRLANEVRATPNPVIASWLQFYLGHAQWATGRLDLAGATFEAITQRQPAVRVAAHAYVAMSRTATMAGDLPGALAAYQQMLAAFPVYRRTDYLCDRTVDPYPVSWDESSELCTGAARIPARVTALERLIAARAAGAQMMGDANPIDIRRAEASLEVGRAWEEKVAVDPGRAGIIRDQSDARAHYQAAITAAPSSAPAGEAAWRLIALSAPYEWEGDWQGQAAWNVEKFSAFLNEYPAHALAGEARFKIAMARWAQAGYPEVYQIIFSADWPSWNVRKAELDQWFDTRGFGGGRGPTIAQHMLRLPEIIEMLKAIVTERPKTPSAPMAQYWVAVMFDYGLDRPADARVEYLKFLKMSPKLEPYVGKAQRRLVALVSRK